MYITHLKPCLKFVLSFPLCKPQIAIRISNGYKADLHFCNASENFVLLLACYRGFSSQVENHLILFILT